MKIPNAKKIIYIRSLEDTLNDKGIKTKIIKLMRKKGTSCACCGMKALFFVRYVDESKNKCKHVFGRDKEKKLIMFNIDHIVPSSLGGSNDSRNLQITCEPCNTKKSSKFYNKKIILLTIIHTKIKKIFHKLNDWLLDTIEKEIKK